MVCDYLPLSLGLIKAAMMAIVVMKDNDEWVNINLLRSIVMVSIRVNDWEATETDISMDL